MYLGKVKRIYAIVFLAILMVNAGGFYVYYILQLQQIRSEMRQALRLMPDNALDVLTLTLPEYKEAKVDEHEVRVNGKMYDIARIKTSGDVVKIFCLHDEKEDNLMVLLSEIISKPLKDRRSMPASILEFLSLIFIAPENEVKFGSVAEVKIFTTYYFSIQEAFLHYDSPPPWLLPKLYYKKD